MAILPTREFSIELTPGSGTWTDLAADVVRISTRRGRNRELGAFEAGTGTVILRNESRKYDPEYAAGAYYGNLRPNRRIRFRATYSAVTYPAMIGYIDRIEQHYQGPNGAYTVITFSDLFKVLNRIALPPSVYAAEVGVDSPATWWRLGEAAGSTSFAPTVGTGTGTLVGSPAFGASGLTVRDSNGAVTIGPAASTNGLQLPVSAAISGTAAFSLEFLIRMSTITSAPMIYAQAVNDTRSNVLVYVDAVSHKLTFSLIDSAGSSGTAVSTTVLTTGVTYHVVVTRAAGAGAMKIYIDGADVTTSGTTAPSAAIEARAAYLGLGVPYAPSGNQYDGILDEVAIYPAELSSARVSAHSAASKIAWSGDSVATRAGRILDLAAIAAGDRSLDTGSTSLQSTSLGGTALAYLQKIEETENGELFITRDGKVRLLGRREAVQGGYQTTKGILTDSPPGAGEVGYREGGPVYDVDLADIIDKATVSRDGGVAVTYLDSAAQTEFQINTVSHEGLLHDSEDYSADYAAWIVNTHKAPTTRIGAVELDLPADPANSVPLILGMEIGDRVTVRRRPKTGAAISTDYRLEAIAHDTGGARWHTRLELSPFNLAAGLPVFVWDVTKWDQHVWGI